MPATPTGTCHQKCCLALALNGPSRRHTAGVVVVQEEEGKDESLEGLTQLLREALNQPKSPSERRQHTRACHASTISQCGCPLPHMVVRCGSSAPSPCLWTPVLLQA